METNSTIIRLAGKLDPFARIPRTLLDDPGLSWGAKGILSYILSKPDGWKVRVGDLLNRATDGKHSVRAALLELRRAGYAKLVQQRDGGRVSSWVLHVSDIASFPKLDPENQDLEKLDPENQDLENRHHSKKDSSKTECSNNDLGLEGIGQGASKQARTVETKCGDKSPSFADPLLLDAPPRRFTPPRVDEVTDFLKASGLNGESARQAEAFVNHHAARGWMLGRVKMKDWRAAARTWKMNFERFSAPSSPVVASAQRTAAERQAEEKAKRDQYQRELEARLMSQGGAK